MCPKSFLFNGTEVRLVPYQGQDTCPETKIAFYVPSDGTFGVRIFHNGKMLKINPNPNKHGKAKDHGKQTYLDFKDAWGHHRHISSARAVYSAWEAPIPPKMTIDHINGNTLCNRIENLRCVSSAINIRDGGFLQKLRNKGINPTYFARPLILRFYDRMAEFKATHTRSAYERLTREELLQMLVEAPL